MIPALVSLLLLFNSVHSQVVHSQVVQEWGQCGGDGYGGKTECVKGTYCYVKGYI